MVGRRGSSGGGGAGARSQPAASRTSIASGQDAAELPGAARPCKASCCRVFAQVTLLSMEPTAGRPPLGVGEPAASRPQRVSRAGQRRRPSGEAPPLPRTLNRSGRLWLIAAGAILLLWAGVVANQRTAARVLEVDHAVVAWMAGMRSELLTDVMQAVHALGSRWTVRILFWSTVAALVALRRFRHLFVFLGATLAVTALTGLFAYLYVWPRPLGVEILGDWSGYANPSRPVATLAALLMGMLYSLAPAGRLRRLGKPVIAVLVAALSLSLLYLAVNSPSDVLIAVVIGVTVPLVAFRMITPNEVFPVTYHRGSSAHLDVGGRRGQAIHRALEDQLGVHVGEIKPFGLSGSAGSTPCGSGSRATPRAGCSPSCTPAATCARTGGTSWAGRCCTAGWRTRSRTTPCAGWSSRRTTPCG